MPKPSQVMQKDSQCIKNHTCLHVYPLFYFVTFILPVNVSRGSITEPKALSTQSTRQTHSFYSSRTLIWLHACYSVTQGQCCQDTLPGFYFTLLCLICARKFCRKYSETVSRYWFRPTLPLATNAATAAAVSLGAFLPTRSTGACLWPRLTAIRRGPATLRASHGSWRLLTDGWMDGRDCGCKSISTAPLGAIVEGSVQLETCQSAISIACGSK